MSSGERIWPARLRWRLRGAWLWPAFVLITLIDGVLLHLLPPVRLGFTREGMTLIFGILVAAFGNLFLIGAVGPFLARRLAAREAGERQRLPKPLRIEALQDRVGTALLGLGLLGIVAAGLGSREVVVVDSEQREKAALAFHSYIQRSGDGELIRNDEASNTAKLGEGYFRTCVPNDDRRRFQCFFLDATKKPVEIVRDPSAEPNRIEP